jgi:endoglucanase
LEGQHEPKDAESNPNGAPLELYIGNMWWDDNSTRTIQQTMTEIKQLGINMIRLPVTPQTLEAMNEQGMTRVWNGSEKNPNGRLKNKANAYPYDTARKALEGFLDEANKAGLKVLVDIHSCSNYLGWRAGRLDAKPPYVDATRVGYDFMREEYSCAQSGNPSSVTTVQAYGEAKWLENLRDIAGLAKTYPNIIGIDIFNEPWDYTWDEWATLAEKAYAAIDAVNKDVLVFVEGVGSALQDGTDVDHGDEFLNPNWGENFYGFTKRPLQIPRNRVVLSPHTYGPAVYVQQHFMDGACSELHGDEAGEAKCQINISGNVSKMRAGWDEHFGFLREQNYAMVIGEFGGNMDWPKKTRAAENEMWGHITTNVDEQWQNAFVDYMKEKKIEACYWSINPESADTYGIYKHKYDPVSAEAEWGKWEGFDTRKTDMLKRFWGI